MNADPCGSGSTALVTSNIRILDPNPNPQYLSSSRSDYLKVGLGNGEKGSTTLICMVSVSQFGSFFVWLLVCFSQYLCFLSSILFSFQFVSYYVSGFFQFVSLVPFFTLPNVSVSFSLSHILFSAYCLCRFHSVPPVFLSVQRQFLSLCVSLVL